MQSMRANFKTPPFAQFLCQAQILILEIPHVFLWLKSSPSLTSNKIELFETGSCDYYFGKPRQKSSSHRIYKTPWQGDPRINIQNYKGKAKVYQVKQVLMAIEKLEGDHVSEK